MADINQILNDIKGQLGPLAEQNVKEFAAQAKQDAEAFLAESKQKLTKWMELLASGQIDQDEFQLLVDSQKAVAAMRALREANAGALRIEKFRDSVFNVIVTTAVKAIAPKPES
ncbi:MAG: hypothetical protein V7609_1423 [Verrucomicrobiota bacterium]